MTAARHIVAGGVTWSFSGDDPPPAAARMQAILRAELVDEVTGAPPGVPVATFTGLRGATTKAAGSFVGIVGAPRTHFPDVGIALARARLDVSATGFLPLSLEAAMGPQPGYPAAFTAPDLGVVALHRAPVAIEGRVVSRTTGALAGVVVEITRLWPRMDAITGPGDAPECLCIWAALRADRGAGASLRRRNLTQAVEVKRLLLPGVAGEVLVKLSDRVAVAVGQILTIDPGDDARIEHIGIAAIDAASSPDQPAMVTLDLPLRHDHAAGVSAVRAVTGAAGAANILARPARVGDVSLYSPQVGIGPATTAVEVMGGGSPPEFHTVARYRVTTDADGDFRLPPLHRAAYVQLRVGQPGPPTPIVRVVTLEWGQSAMTADFIFP